MQMSELSMEKPTPTVQMSQTLNIPSFLSPRTSSTKPFRMTAIALHSLRLSDHGPQSRSVHPILREPR